MEILSSLRAAFGFAPKNVISGDNLFKQILDIWEGFDLYRGKKARKKMLYAEKDKQKCVLYRLTYDRKSCLVWNIGKVCFQWGIYILEPLD